MQKLSQKWDEVCGLVIRPQRREYDLNSLGPQIFRIDDGVYERTDVTVTNPRGMTLHCSHFEPTPSQRRSETMPCVIYLHGNCGSRQDCLDYVPVLLPLGITLFTFDFSGSGQSDGEYVSLGHFEKQDLASVVDHLLQTKRVSRIGLWGRSMGAVTSIMYASKDSTIGGIVCDSPYCELAELMQELALGYKSWVPKWLLKMAISSMRDTIMNKVGFDIYDLNTMKYAGESDVPALLAHADEDLMVPQEHSKRIQEVYQGECFFMRFEGGHNDDRPTFYLEAAANFFVHHLVTKPGPVEKGRKAKPAAGKDAVAAPPPRHADPAAGVIGGGELTSDEEEALPGPPHRPQGAVEDDLFSESIDAGVGSSLRAPAGVAAADDVMVEVAPSRATLDAIDSMAGDSAAAESATSAKGVSDVHQALPPPPEVGESADANTAAAGGGAPSSSTPSQKAEDLPETSATADVPAASVAADVQSAVQKEPADDAAPADGSAAPSRAD